MLTPDSPDKICLINFETISYSQVKWIEMVTEQVLSTAELLELILLNLDLRTLLTTAQRTCRDWNSFIRDSHSLQENLYFIPDENVSKS